MAKKKKRLDEQEKVRRQIIKDGEIQNYLLWYNNLIYLDEWDMKNLRQLKATLPSTI